MFRDKMAWLPLTKVEVKNGVLGRYHREEGKAAQSYRDEAAPGITWVPGVGGLPYFWCLSP